tara:strand:- start:14891 stop:16255 length:1365 start_codon:yes stop_codon:yes gene_type:complete
MGRYIGLYLNKGQGGGGLGPTEPYDRSSGITTDANNNVTAIDLGTMAYSDMVYDAGNVGLVTGYTETIGGVSDNWEIEYDSQNLVTKVAKFDPNAPRYNATSNMYTVNENSTPIIYCDTENVPAGTQLYWDSSSDSDLTTASLSLSLSTVGQFATDQAQVQVEFKEDSETEGTETIYFRIYTDAAKTDLVATTPAITISDTSTGGGDGSSSSSPVDISTDWSTFVSGKTSSDNGKYWITDGTTVSQTYCIFRDGGWIKIAQMNSNNDVMNSAEMNAAGQWIDSEINTNQAGKLASSLINNISHKNFLLRVTGSPGDAFLNSRQGSMIFKYVGGDTLPNWGTSQDPTGQYDLCLDHDNTGTGYEIMRYSYESRTLCSNDGNHGGNGSYWVSDHNYNGTWQNQIWGSSGAPICWTISNARIHTNLHWMGGPAGSSSGNQQWGQNSDNAVAFFMQPQ